MTPGEAVQTRRSELGLSRAELARRADVDPKTLQSLEQDARWPLDVNRARIEAELGWAPGSLDSLREGGEPTLLQPDRPRRATPKFTVADQRRLERDWVEPQGGGGMRFWQDSEGRRVFIGGTDTNLPRVRESMRLVGQLPEPVQSIVYAHAQAVLPEVVDKLDQENSRRLVGYAYRLLDEQEAEASSNSSEADVELSWDDLPRVANTRGVEPEEGDDDYGSGA